MVGDEVHVGSGGVLVFEVDGGGKNLVAQGEDGDTGFEASGAAEKMSGHGLGGADGEFVLAEKIADGVSFQGVADRSRGAVSVHVANVGRLDAGVADSVFHYSESAFLLGRRLRDRICIS